MRGLPPSGLLVLPLALLVWPAACRSPASEEDRLSCEAEVTRLQRRVGDLEAQLRDAELSYSRSAGAEATRDRGSTSNLRGTAVPSVQMGEKLEPLGSKGWYRQAFFATCCVVLAALAAGLTMGLVSIEPMEMKIIVNTEDKDIVLEKDKIKLKEDQAAAKRVLPLIQDHHRLLVTLLLMNSIANEALPLFLDHIVPSWLAVCLSVTLVLMFGEIIPSAIFTGSEQLRIAAKFAPTVTFFKVILTPIAWPIAKVLDYLLGEDHKGRYNFAELRAIVGIHADLRSDGHHAVLFKSHDDKDRQIAQGYGIITTELPHHFTDETVVTFNDAQDGKHPARSKKLKSDGTFYYAKPCAPLTSTANSRDKSCTFKLYTHQSRRREHLITFKDPGDLTSGAFMVQERDEIKIMHGVMKLTHMCARDGLKPLSEVHMLEMKTELTRPKMHEILELGHSRLPVYSQNMHNVRGFILAKKLIVVTPDDHKLVEDMDIMEPVLVKPDIPMLDLLNKFQAERCHIALVCSCPDVVKRVWDEHIVIPPDVHMMGIVTLEDIIEKLIQEEIWDEKDPDVQDGCCGGMHSVVHKTSTNREGDDSASSVSFQLRSKRVNTSPVLSGRSAPRSTKPNGLLLPPGSSGCASPASQLEVPLLGEDEAWRDLVKQ